MKIIDAYELLRTGHESGRMAHGYIIEGDVRGVGTSLVDMLIKLLFCESKKKPCGECRPCREAEAHRLPDLYWIEPEKKSRVISVDQIRDMSSWVNRTAYEGGYKVAVLAYADRLNVNSANAFLKTLEEPPDKTLLFLLVQNPQYLLPTIVSRCQKITITDEFDAGGEEWWDELAEVLSRPIESALDAQANAELIKQVFSRFADEAEEEISQRVENDGVEISDEQLVGNIQALYREKRASLMRFIMMWYRDILVLTCESENDMLSNKGYVEALNVQAEGLRTETALENLEIVETMNRRLDRMSTGQEMACLSSGFAGLYENTFLKAKV